MSYTLNYTGSEIDDILDHAAPGGAIDQALAAKQDALTFDAVPTQGSTNPAESGGIYDAIQAGGAAALAAFATDSVSGDVVSFPDGADNIPVKSFVGSIVPQQSGSGDPAPDNIRPISGWTGAKIIRAGATLDSDIEQGGINSNGINVVSDNRIRLKSYYPVDDTKTYCISVESTQGVDLEFSISFYDVADYTTFRTSGTSWLTAPYYFTPPSGTKYIRTLIRKADNGTISPSQVENFLLGEAIITLDFGETVYAGTITALGGGLWSVQPTHAIVDLGSLSWGYNSTYDCFRANDLNGQCIAPSASGDTSAVCSMFKRGDFVSGTGLENGEFCVADSGWSPSTSTVVAKDTNYTDAAQFKTAVTGQTLVYALKTLPDPIIVSAEDLQTLLGSNTVWTDCGSVTEMEYRADTALYIQKLLNGGTLSTLSMASPSPSLSLGRVGVLAEPEEAEPEQTEEVGEQPEESEEE